MSLTGLKDIDRLVLQYLDDRELLRICSVDRKTWNEVCNDDFLKRRLSRYPNIQKYKNQDETWKQFFLRAIYYISKLKEDFEFQYTEGDFQRYYDILSNYEENELMDKAAEIGFGSIPFLDYLLKRGLVISPLTLNIAAKKGNLEAVKFLVEHGGIVHAWHNLTLRSASGKGHLEIVKFLVEQGADIHANEDEPLRAASRSGHLEVVKYLMELGANVHANEDEALRGASERGHLKMVKFLVEHGADVHAKKDAAIRLAKRNGHLQIIRYLENVKSAVKSAKGNRRK